MIRCISGHTRPPTNEISVRQMVPKSFVTKVICEPMISRPMTAARLTAKAPRTLKRVRRGTREILSRVGSARIYAAAANRAFARRNGEADAGSGRGAGKDFDVESARRAVVRDGANAAVNRLRGRHRGGPTVDDDRRLRRCEFDRGVDETVVRELADAFFSERDELAGVAEEGDAGLADGNGDEVRRIAVNGLRPRLGTVDAAAAIGQPVVDVNLSGEAEFFRRKRERPVVGARVREDVESAHRTMIRVRVRHERFAAAVRVVENALVGRNGWDVGLDDDAIRTHREEQVRGVHLAEPVADADDAGGERGDESADLFVAAEDVREWIDPERRRETRAVEKLVP